MWIRGHPSFGAGVGEKKNIAFFSNGRQRKEREVRLSFA